MAIQTENTQLIEPVPQAGPDEAETEHETELTEDLLVEDVSIDGMCGVY